MSAVVISGDTSGSVTLQAPAVAGSTVITLPSTSMTLGGGNPLLNTVFTSSTTWVCPVGVTSIEILCVAGGGGSSTFGTGAGGGHGGQSYGTYVVTPGTTYTVTVGTGGAGFSGSGAGTAGGSSSFGALISATGGGGMPVSGTGTNGVGSNGTYYNTTAGAANGQSVTANGLGYLPLLSMPTGTPTNNASAAAIVYSLNSVYAPGRGGNSGSGAGGIGGVICIQYVGA